MTAESIEEQIADVVGRRHIHTGRALRGYCQGWRSGEGEAELAATPGSLVELWRVLMVCVRSDRIVIMQAQNTGLTEGSTPNGSYDRPVVVISTLRLDGIHLIEDGRQIVALPGATLYELEERLAPLGREPHSVIGSSCIGATVMGGVCNNSGGALVRRGPAYTELSLFARRTADDRLELVNHLGISLGDDPEEVLRRLEKGEFGDIDDAEEARASCEDYVTRVRKVDADTPGRFNADERTLHEAAGCAGKIAVFAVRLDTFPAEPSTTTYYVGTNDTAALTQLRRAILTQLDPLPVSGEYVHREMFDAARVYGRDMFALIYWLGTRHLPRIFKLKGKADMWTGGLSFLPDNAVDRLMQGLSRLIPDVVPRRMRDFRDRYEHHLILKMGANARNVEPFLDDAIGAEGWFRCDETEAKKAALHRFVAAGAAARYCMCRPGEVEALLPLDIALKRNDADWFETLPEEIERDLAAKFYYGHFLCHVLHQDYAIRKGADPKAVKARMLRLLDERGAEYPAEHNVGHLYEAKPVLADFYAELDPTNSFNPGIGGTSKQKRHAAPAE